MHRPSSELPCEIPLVGPTISSTMRFASLFSSAVLSLFLFTSPAYGFFQALDKLRPKENAGGGIQKVLQQVEEAKNASKSGFKDVKEGDWFGSYVSSVAKWGIVSGYKDKDGKPTGKYGPGDPVTVAEILKMTMKSAKVDEKECPALVKHPKAGNHWAKVYVACGEAQGVRLLKGNPDLNRGASRAEVLTILFDAFQDSVPEESSDFTDSHGHAYEADIAFAAKLGIVSGDKDEDGNPKGTFRPNDKVNRAEAAKMIYLKVAAAVAKKKAEEGEDGNTEDEDEDFDVEEEEEEEPVVREEDKTMMDEEAASPEPVTIAVTARNYIFSPSAIRVKKGQEVTLNFQNTGKHTFTVKGLGIDKLLNVVTSSLTFTAEKNGEFELICSVPGHKERGMKGKVIVE